jgi:crotonobetainyl-CoA:carnitine CoA-transferase CaiB-like acyl-CoA transferase
VDAPPPELGAHTAEVLARLGFTPAEQDELKAKGVI